MGVSGDKRMIGFEVTGDPAMAMATARKALEEEQFVVTVVDDWNLTAARGNRMKALFLGAISPYVEVGVVARSRPQTGTVTIEINQTPPGFAYAGGVLGAKKSKKSIDRVCVRLKDAYERAGVLTSSTLD